MPRQGRIALHLHACVTFFPRRSTAWSEHINFHLYGMTSVSHRMASFSPTTFLDSIRYKGGVISYTSSFPSLILVAFNIFFSERPIFQAHKLVIPSLQNHQHHQSQHRILYNLIVSSTDCQPSSDRRRRFDRDESRDNQRNPTWNKSGKGYRGDEIVPQYKGPRKHPTTGDKKNH